ncbi:hypothetical protein VP01_8g3 [Puccinia sorghi]|uniref:Uncharacterized protein n=1 Tax=Puccinia sorghi TaxID=27349 RepID=A0A0L6U7R5_9BASI|nr:hypothetical protein VP01_8g3 [Puccinia sorghi]
MEGLILAIVLRDVTCPLKDDFWRVTRLPIVVLGWPGGRKGARLAKLGAHALSISRGPTMDPTGRYICGPSTLRWLNQILSSNLCYIFPYILAHPLQKCQPTWKNSNNSFRSGVVHPLEELQSISIDSKVTYNYIKTTSVKIFSTPLSCFASNSGCTDAAEKLLFSTYQKLTSDLKMMAYGGSPGSLDEYTQMSEKTSLEFLKRFFSEIISIYKQNSPLNHTTFGYPYFACPACFMTSLCWINHWFFNISKMEMAHQLILLVKKLSFCFFYISMELWPKHSPLKALLEVPLSILEGHGLLHGFINENLWKIVMTEVILQSMILEDGWHKFATELDQFSSLMSPVICCLLIGPGACCCIKMDIFLCYQAIRSFPWQRPCKIIQNLIYIALQINQKPMLRHVQQNSKCLIIYPEAKIDPEWISSQNTWVESNKLLLKLLGFIKTLC